MSSYYPTRRSVQQSQPVLEYAVVPSNARTRKLTRPSPGQYSPRPPLRSPSTGSYRQSVQNGRGAIAMGVATGAIGAGYGPYSYQPNPDRDAGVYNSSRFSATPSDTSMATGGQAPTYEGPAVVNTISVPQFLWDKDPENDDLLHNPDPVRDARMDRSCNPLSWRGWVNAFTIVVLICGLMTLFAGYPIIVHFHRPGLAITGFNVGGINGSGQIPSLPGLPRLIDRDTPSNVMTRTGTDGVKYNLVFSDEFNTEGRSFYPGDDPYWEAVDLHYWPTGDLEWYDPSAVTTADGKLVITMSEETINELNFKSGMVSSWNKLCFNTGYVEVSVSLPGSPRAPGLWPGVWSMGNLGRAGYGSTTEGMWPYSYDTCDIGTYPNQTAKDGTPAAASTGAPGGGQLSVLPGQRLSACTCPGSDHPGPSSSTGRGVPEVDILEAQVDVFNDFHGEVSQSFQMAPYNFQYHFNNQAPQTTIYNTSLTKFNPYTGGIYQQSASAVTSIDSQFYNATAYQTYAYELWSDPSHRDDGYITWLVQDTPSWTVTSESVGPDPVTKIGQRLIPEEPMYLIFNLGLAPGFQKQDFKHLQFPSKMYIDYVRVYQRASIKKGITCNPTARPTTDYINKHMNAYTNPNLTRWIDAGYTFPRNSAYDGC